MWRAVAAGEGRPFDEASAVVGKGASAAAAVAIPADRGKCLRNVTEKGGSVPPANGRPLTAARVHPATHRLATLYYTQHIIHTPASVRRRHPRVDGGEQSVMWLRSARAAINVKYVTSYGPLMAHARCTYCTLITIIQCDDANRNNILLFYTREGPKKKKKNNET